MSAWRDVWWILAGGRIWFGGEWTSLPSDKYRSRENPRTWRWRSGLGWLESFFRVLRMRPVAIGSWSCFMVRNHTTWWRRFSRLLRAPWTPRANLTRG